MDRRPRREWWILGGLVLLALAVRGSRIGESLWYDEIAAYRDYAMNGPWFVVTRYADPANHVLHTLLSWASATALEPWLGPELALRLPSLLASLLAVPLVAALGRRAGGARVAAVAGLFAAAWPVAVLAGTEARGYALVIALAALATLRLDDVATRGGARPILGYAVATALLLWTHAAAVFLPIGHAAWLLALARARPARRGAVRGGVAIAAAALLTLLLYAPILGQMLALRGTFAAADGDEPSPIGVEGLDALLQLGGSWWWPAALPGLTLLGLGFASLRRAPRARAIVLPALAGLPLLVLALLGAGSWMYARFALFALPGAAVLAALGLDALARRSRLLAATALALLLALGAADLMRRPPRQPLREAIAWIDAHRAADERVLLVGLRVQATDVYTIGRDWHPPVYAMLLGADLDARLAEGDPDWAIVLYERSVPIERRARLAAAGFREAARFPGWIDRGNGAVVVLRRERNAPQS